MKFSIAYAAKWGHALHVELTFAAADGYQDTISPALFRTTKANLHTYNYNKSVTAKPQFPISNPPDELNFGLTSTYFSHLL